MKFELGPAPVIFDVGGYKGNWTQIALDKYPGSKVYTFEPVPEFFEIIRKKFEGNSNVTVCNFGLAKSTYSTKFFVNEDSSSIVEEWAKRSPGGVETTVSFVGIIDFLRTNKIEKIDLMGLNVEGAEYDLLDYLLARPEIMSIDNLLVQFHTNVPHYDLRRSQIRKQLDKHHFQLFNYDYVFEAWKRKPLTLPEILCIGDSHISMFSGEDGVIEPRKVSRFENFEALNIGPVLAYNLPDKGLAFDSLSQLAGRNLLVCLGEIDCRAQVKRRAGDGDPTPIIESIVQRYFDGLSEIKKAIPADSRLYTFSVTPELKERPHWYYYGNNLQAFDAPHGTLAERRSYKDAFNRLVKQRSLENGIEYVSIYEWLMEEGDAMGDYFLDDIHLSPVKVKNMIRRAFLG